MVLLVSRNAGQCTHRQTAGIAVSMWLNWNFIFTSSIKTSAPAGLSPSIDPHLNVRPAAPPTIYGRLMRSYIHCSCFSECTRWTYSLCNGHFRTHTLHILKPTVHGCTRERSFIPPSFFFSNSQIFHKHPHVLVHRAGTFRWLSLNESKNVWLRKERVKERQISSAERTIKHTQHTIIIKSEGAWWSNWNFPLAVFDHRQHLFSSLNTPIHSL